MPLETGRIEIGVSDEEVVERAVLSAVGMRGDRVVVRIHVVNVGGEPFALGCPVVVLLAEVPLDSTDVAESGDKFAIEKFALGTEVAVIVVRFVGVFGFGELEVEHDPPLFGVAEQGLPASKFGVIVPRLRARLGDVRPRVVAVASYVIREEIYAVCTQNKLKIDDLPDLRSTVFQLSGDDTGFSRLCCLYDGLNSLCEHHAREPTFGTADRNDAGRIKFGMSCARGRRLAVTIQPFLTLDCGMHLQTKGFTVLPHENDVHLSNSGIV